MTQETSVAQMVDAVANTCALYGVHFVMDGTASTGTLCGGWRGECWMFTRPLPADQAGCEGGELQNIAAAAATSATTNAAAAGGCAAAAAAEGPAGGGPAAGPGTGDAILRRRRCRRGH